MARLSLVKTASPAAVSMAGAVVTFTFQVTNTANVTLHGIGIEEQAFTGSGALITPTDCVPTTLAPAAVAMCTSNYAVTQTDVDGGGVSNSAKVIGIDPTNAIISSEIATADVSAAARPGLAVSRSASTDSVSAVGDVITYSFLVTNTGNVTLSDIGVLDMQDGAEGIEQVTATCAATASLRPATWTSCIATRTVTKADLRHGSLSDSAIAIATDPAGAAARSTTTASLMIEATAVPAFSDAAADGQLRDGSIAVGAGLLLLGAAGFMYWRRVR
jgi:hypothetical protein